MLEQLRKYSIAEIKLRRMRILAQLIRDHWEEGSGMDTRCFEVPLIHDSLVDYGQSASGGTYREHAVPKSLIRDGCLEIYDRNGTIEDVQQALIRHLWIVRITTDEARRLDCQLRMKTCMPKAWRFGIDDPFARFHEAKIPILRRDSL